jgi:hypothetical protein
MSGTTTKRTAGGEVGGAEFGTVAKLLTHIACDTHSQHDSLGGAASLPFFERYNTTGFMNNTLSHRHTFSLPLGLCACAGDDDDVLSRGLRSREPLRSLPRHCVHVDITTQYPVFALVDLRITVSEHTRSHSHSHIPIAGRGAVVGRVRRRQQRRHVTVGLVARLALARASGRGAVRALVRVHK